MKIIRFTYKSKILYEYGVFLSIVMLVLLLAGGIIIPTMPGGFIEGQLMTLNGRHLKFNDGAIVAGFLESVKDNNGYLVLGTSESSHMKSGNYYDFLNADTSVVARFSVLSGAGRTCGIHIPMLANHKISVDSLKVIYMINPVYWRSELCKFNKDYWINYNNYVMCKQVDLTDNERREYYGVVEPYFGILKASEKIDFAIEYWLRQLRSNYFLYLKYYLDPNEFERKLSFIDPDKPGLDIYKNYNKPDLELIDTAWNISFEFHDRKSLNPIIEEETYRFDELKAFITLSRDLNMDVLYIVAPYNQTFIEKYDPALFQGYSNTVDRIKTLLEEENAIYIDATDVAKIKGSFIDNQHHSSYGAYLIYLKIKSFINENS